MARAPGGRELGTRDAFEAFYAEHVAFVWRVLEWIEVPRPRLEEAVQDVFLVAWRRRPPLEGPRAARSWLYAVAARVAQNHRRVHARKAGRELSAADLPLLDRLIGDAADAGGRLETRETLRALLARMPEDRRLVLWMADVEEMTAAEIGALLGVNANTVSTRLRAARQELSRLWHDGAAPGPSRRARERMRVAILAAVGRERADGGRAQPAGPGRAPPPVTRVASTAAWLTGAAALVALVVTALALRSVAPARAGAGGRPEPAAGSEPARGARPPRIALPALERPVRERPAAPAPHPLFAAFASRPDDHPNIPDVSYAGYRYGEPPEPPPRLPVIDVRAHGARGDGRTDDTAAIRRALASVGAGGAIVQFPAGRYVVSDHLPVRTSRTVLRGRGREETILLLRRGLSALGGVPAGTTPWTYTGGLIRFRPDDDLPWSHTEGWTKGRLLARVRDAVPRGSRELALSTTAGLAPGDFVLLEFRTPPGTTLPRVFTGLPEWSERYFAARPRDELIDHDREYRMPFEILRVDGRTHKVTLRQPLPMEILPAWGAALHANERVLRDVGLERLTVVAERGASPESWDDRGFNAIYFNKVIDGFARDLALADVDIGFALASARNVSLTDVRLQATRPRRVVSAWLSARYNTQDVLIEGFDVDPSGWSGGVLDGKVGGLVFSRGRARFDGSAGFPFDTVLTEVAVLAPRSDRLPHAREIALRGTHLVHWNVTFDPAPAAGCRPDLMAMGAAVGVRGCSKLDGYDGALGDSGALVDRPGATVAPANLYEAQRAARRMRESPPADGPVDPISRSGLR